MQCLRRMCRSARMFVFLCLDSAHALLSSTMVAAKRAVAPKWKARGVPKLAPTPKRRGAGAAALHFSLFWEEEGFLAHCSVRQITTPPPGALVFHRSFRGTACVGQRPAQRSSRLPMCLCDAKLTCFRSPCFGFPMRIRCAHVTDLSFLFLTFRMSCSNASWMMSLGMR